MRIGFVDFQQLREVGVFSYSVNFGFKSLVNGLVDLRSCMVVLSVSKLRTELLEFMGPVFDSPGLIPRWKWSPCVIIVC